MSLTEHQAGPGMKVEVSTLIDAPPAITYAAVLDVVRWPEFIAGIQRVELLTPGPVGVGTRLRETRVMLGREASEEMTFAEIEPLRRCLLTAESHGTRYRTEHRFELEGARTRLTLAFEGRPVTVFARLIFPLGLLMLGTLRRMLERDLADLKREAERRAEIAQSPRP